MSFLGIKHANCKQYVDTQEAFVQSLADDAVSIDGVDYLPVGKPNSYKDYELIYYINDVTIENEQVLVEYGANGIATGTYEYGLQRLSVEHVNETKEYYLYNGTGSVVQTTAQNGSAFLRYTYDPFGNVTSINAPMTVDIDDLNRYTYNGEDYDYNTGLQYLRARYYSTDIGRFISQDTFLGRLFSPLSQNRFTYCQNNPVMRDDPNGHDSYIIYDKTVGWMKNNAKNERKIIADKFYDGDTSKVHLVPVSDAASFKSGWDSIGVNDSGKEVNVENVVVFSHSTTNYIRVGNEIVYGHDFVKYQKKEIDNLILLNCNAGHLTYYEVMEENVASNFSKIVEDGVVMASDGEVHTSFRTDNFERILLNILTTGIASLFSPSYTNTKYKSCAEDEFRLYENYSDTPRDNNEGWFMYSYVDGKVVITPTDKYTYSIVEMIDSMNSYRTNCG